MNCIVQFCKNSFFAFFKEMFRFEPLYPFFYVYYFVHTFLKNYKKFRQIQISNRCKIIDKWKLVEAVLNYLTWVHFEINFYSNQTYFFLKMAAEVKFIDRSYGKAWVKLLHVERNGNVHSIKEYEVSTLITLDTDKDYIKV